MNPSFPAKTVPAFIAYAKASPGKIAMATQGNGGSAHIYGELFQQMAGVDMVPVPYRGEGPALIDLIGGQVQVMFAIMPSAIEYIRSRLRALAVTSATRVQPLPEIPAVGEFVPGYQATAFEGVGAPKNTPTEIVDKLNREINALLDDPKVRAQLASLGSTILNTSPTSFGKLIAGETDKWGKVVRAANIKPEEPCRKFRRMSLRRDPHEVARFVWRRGEEVRGATQGRAATYERTVAIVAVLEPPDFGFRRS